MKTVVKQPHDCSPQELDEFESLVLQGGEVTPNGLSRRIKKAEQLVFCDRNPVIGVGAVKNPNDGYRTSVFTKAGVLEQLENFKFELGWLYTSPAARGEGVGNQLMEAAIRVSGAGGIFATTRFDNDAMHYLFDKYSFEKLGEAYQSANGDYQLVLYAYRP